MKNSFNFKFIEIHNIQSVVLFCMLFFSCCCFSQENQSVSSEKALLELKSFSQYEEKKEQILYRLNELKVLKKELLSTEEYSNRLISFGNAPDINDNYEAYERWKKSKHQFTNHYISVEMLTKNLK